MSFSLQPLKALAGDFLQATFRGVPFAVMGSAGHVGRRVATHDYPGHDGVWSEDLGRKGRIWNISGLLVGPLCYTNRDLLQLVVERKGAGLLIHPSLGILKACCVHFEYRERSGYTNVIDLSFSFIEQKELLSTLITTGIHALIAGASMALGLVSSSGYINAVGTLFSHGASVSRSARLTALQWGNSLHQCALRPQLLSQSSRQIMGNNGRYLGNSGVLSATENTSLLSQYRQRLDQVVSDLSSFSTPEELSEAIKNIASTYVGFNDDPNTRLSLLLPLAKIPQDTPSPLPTRTAVLSEAEEAVKPWTELLCMLMLIGPLTEALSDWEPETSSDAQSMIERISTLFDDLQMIAGDNGLDELYRALITLGSYILEALNQKTIMLPDSVTITRVKPLPSLTLAQQLYADGSRSSELMQRTNTPHPAFMPLSFEAKSA